MKNKYFTSLFIGILALSMLAAGSQNANALVDDPESVFDISLLSPNTNPARNAWAALMAEELPKIGIGIDTHSSTGWDVIGPRTFSHERDDSDSHRDENDAVIGAIPLYDDGGFDIFFVGLSGALDYNPTASYSNVQFSPSSNNFASYDNDEISDLITQYTSELDPAKRALIAPQIQEFAYDDQPYINIINTAGLWTYDAAWTTIQPIDFIYLGTTNKADGWKDMDHPTDDDIVYAHSYELTEFTPFAIQSYIAAQYLNPIYGGLYERDPADPNNAYAPLMAKDQPTWNEHKNVSTIELRDDVTFSTGVPVTVADVVNSFHMHMSPAWSVANYAGLTTYIANNDSIRAVNDTHLEITLKTPYFLATQLYSIPIFDMAEIGTPSATVSYGGIPAVGPLGDGDNGYDFNTNAEKFHGSGPFVYAVDGIDATAGNVKIEADTDYWNLPTGATPNIDTVQFNKYGSKEAALSDLQGGTVHIIDAEFYLEPGEVEGLTGVEYEIVGDFGTQMMTVNMDHPILGTGVDTPLGKDDPTKAEEAARYIRQAVSHAVPRDDIVDTILKGVGTAGTTLWPELAAGYDSSLEPYEYDLEAAQALLEQAGYNIKAKESGIPLVDIVPLALASLFVTAVVVRRRK
ncbi:MAG: ABC transporter substrate-binding protein [Candidatus Kariarchaeaceae archaeon]